MRRVLRNMKSKEYYRYGKWTADAALAQEFPDTLSAVQVSIAKRLPDVELVLQIGDSPSEEYDIRLPLAELRRG